LVACALVGARCAPISRLPQLPQDEVDAELRNQQIAHMRDYYGQLHRVDTAAFRIRTANVADCGERIAAQIGLYAVTPQSLPRRYRSYAREALQITWERPTVISVVDGSPAAQAGIMKGDEITALNGELIPVRDTDDWMTRWLMRNKLKPVEATVRRDGEDRNVTITPVMSCAIPVVYVTKEEVNAYTDGEKIIIQSGIVDIARTDAQLATIIGHELAHVNLQHIQKRQQNELLGTVAGLVVDVALKSALIDSRGVFTREFGRAGALAFSVGFEREADYVGAYYAARAGYDLAGTEEVWREMGLKHPDSIRFARTHPTTPTRFIQMQKVAAEIAGKKARGEPLTPDLRFVPAEQPPMQSGEMMH
jgi:Zn-dependent protease with chaperone function